MVVGWVDEKVDPRAEYWVDEKVGARADLWVDLRVLG